MHIEANRPIAFSHIGQRTNNQDALYPAVNTANAQSTLFLVCDGMGGADKGEIASQLLCQEIVAYAKSENHPVFNRLHLQAALGRVYAACHEYLRQHPFVNRMGSTLALLQFHEQGATVAHLGDSRVYQLRAGKIIFRTNDHKQVNDMVQAGIITAVQAQTHPWRNRLSRAVVVRAGEVFKPSALPVPDLSLLIDVRAGDSFFMCTDGVLEQIDDDILETVVAETMPDEAKMASLLALCSEKTKDNYSGYLISVKSVTQAAPVRRSIIVP